MITTYGKAIKVLSENIYDLKKYRHNDLLQRRNAVVDIYGYEFESVTSAGLDDPATFRISLSPDYIYMYRFSFKVEIFNSKATNFQLFINNVDFTPYFKAQWDGLFINGNGIFPNAQMGRYDILQSTSFIYDIDKKKYEDVLSAGEKEVRIYGDAGFTAKLRLYSKYNHVGR